jgi:hypothetical protein
MSQGLSITYPEMSDAHAEGAIRLQSFDPDLAPEIPDILRA